MPDQRVRNEDEARYRLRRGMAKVAQMEKATGKPRTDAYGRPLRGAHELAERHSSKTIAKWAKGRRTTYVML